MIKNEDRQGFLFRWMHFYISDGRAIQMHFLRVDVIAQSKHVRR